MYLARLFVYPVKSLQGMEVKSWPVTLQGLAFDRRWMLVTPQGEFLTQRVLPSMARIRARVSLEDALARRPRLVLEDEKGHRLEVAPPGAQASRMTVTVWGDRVPALRVDPAADAWLGARLGRPCHLVYFPDDAFRPLSPKYGRPGEGTWFSDGYPLLLLTQASLDDLNRRLKQPVPVERFRPNLVIAGTPPYAEDTWHRIRIGTVPVRVVKPCVRCVITTLDPKTGARTGREPLATLARYRRWRKGVIFGQNAVPEGEGLWTTGETVVVQRAKLRDGLPF